MAVFAVEPRPRTKMRICEGVRYIDLADTNAASSLKTLNESILVFDISDIRFLSVSVPTFWLRRPIEQRKSLEYSA